MSSSRSGHLFPNEFYLRQSKSQMETLLTILNIVCQRFKANQLKRHKRWPSVMTLFSSFFPGQSFVQSVIQWGTALCPLVLWLSLDFLYIYVYPSLWGFPGRAADFIHSN